MRAVFAVLLAAAVLGTAFARCPSGWTFSDTAGERCYKYVSTTTSWNGAEAGCTSLGTYSHLVSIHSNAENVLVYGFCESRRCHIGLNDIANEGSFVWSDSTPVDYTRWHGGEPNNCCGSEDCGEMWDRGGSTPTWNDMPCDARFGNFAYVCSQPAQCPAGKYGTNVKIGCTNCPTGKYRASAGATSVGDCTACPSGRFGSATGLTDSTCSGACQTGHYCPDGSLTATANQCPKGTYGSSTGLGSSACNGVCAAGYYCGLAEVTSEPSGQLCAAGRYGSFGQVNNLCTGPCSAGYYCTSGSGSSTQNQCGSANRYCPEGSSSYTTVTAGYYSVGGANANTRTQQEICEEGYYCSSGVRTLCPAGKYADTTGNSQCTKNCEAGYYCPAGSRTGTQDVCGTGANPANFYCPAGNPTRVTVSSGHYSTPESNPANQRSGQAACTNDYICTNGVRTPKLEWLSNCAGTSTASVSATENVQGTQSVGSFAAQSNEGLGVSYMITQQEPNRCLSPDPLSIASDGTLSLTSEVDLEECPTFTFTVTATATGSVSLTCSVTLTVLDANDTPTIEASPLRQVYEKSKINTAVGVPIFASDPDSGQELTFAISGGDSDNFKIGACSGQIAVLNASLQYVPYDNFMTFTVTVTDDSPPDVNQNPTSLSASTVVTVEILNINDAPVFTGNPTFKVLENAQAGQGLVAPDLGPTAYDEDGDLLTWSISRNDGNAFEINPYTGIITVKNANTINFENRDSYNIQITVTDGLLSASKDFDIAVIDVNDKPILPSSYAFSIPEDAAANTFVGAVTATDQDVGTTVTYSVAPADIFRIVDSPPMTGNIQLKHPNLNFEEKTSYTLIVTATDDGIGGSGDGVEATNTTVVVSVTNVNETPDIWPQTVHVNEHTAIGTAISPAIEASDPDNANLQTQLLFFTLNDTSRVTIGSLNGVLMVAQNFDYETPPPAFAVLVTVTDNGAPVALSDSAVVTVVIDPVNEPPTFNSGVTRSVDELVPIGTAVGTSLMSEAGDPDADTTLTFTMAIDISEAFDVSTSGQITTAKQIDYEEAAIYTIQVSISDGELTTLGQVTIIINNVNERPYVPVTKFSVPENEPAGTSVGHIEATDVDAGDQESLVYTLVTSDPLYRITQTGRVELKTIAPAFGTAPTNLTVRATDSGGLFGDGWCEVSITNVNFRPTVPDHHVYVRENGDAYQVILWDLGASDVDPEQTLQYSIIGGFPEQDLGAFFVYSTNGTVRLNGLSLNYETRNFYQLLIEVEDNGPGSLKAYSTVNVSIVNEPEYPYVAATRFSIAENAAENAVVGTVTASDEDVGNTLSFAISTRDGSSMSGVPFAIAPASGTVTVSGALNYEAQPKYFLFVTVTDSDNLSSTANLTISITNVNEAPTITPENWSISESQPAGAPVGTVQASDVDAGTVLTYAITAGNVGNAFEIAADGVLSLGKKLDFENITSYTLTIQVTDNGAGNLQADGQFVITVLDAYDITFTEFTGATTMVTGGDEKVYIHGSNFGPTAYALSAGHSEATVTATYVSSSTAALTYTPTCSVYDPNTVIECTTVAGVGANMQWTLTVNYESTTHTITITTAATSYDAPAITGVAGADSLATKGGDLITITGTNLGPVGTPTAVKYVAPASATVAYTASQCQVTVADTTATCKSVTGVGSSLTFTITIGSQTSTGYSGTGLFKYTNPAITGISGATQMQTAGSQEVLLTGTNFGAGVTVTATYGDTGVEYAAANCVISVSHTRIKCLSVPGVGAGLRWVVQVGGLYSALSTQTTSYKKPAILGVDGQGAVLADTAGGELVTLTGTNFGPAGGLAAKGAVPVVKYGGWDASRYTANKCNVSVEVPHTVINCFTAPGTGKDHAWQVEIDGQWSPVYLANTSYHPPIVASFPKGNPGASDANTEGDEGVVIQGDYFGSIALGTVPNVTYGPEGYKFQAQGCYILSAHTEIYCNTTEGAGADLKWVVQVDGQDSKAPTTNYGRPQVVSITGQPGGGFSTDGSESFNINGENFGPRYAGFLDYVKYGPTGSEYTAVNCNVESHILITCKTVPGIGNANVFTVSIASQVSDTSSATMAYASPIITNISPNNAVTNGGTMITLDGTNFGLNDVFTKSNIKVEFEGDELLSEFPVTKSKSVHQVKFAVPMGYGIGKQVRLVLHGPNVDMYSNYVLFNYSVPVITSFTPDPTNENIDGLPEFVVTVNGTSFCDSTECGRLWLGETQLTPFNWTHNFIKFRSTLANDDLQVRVGFEPERSSNKVYYENVIPQISALSGSTINNNRYNTAGGQILRFTGTQFHLTGMNVTVRGKPCNFLAGYPKEKTTPAGQEQEYELLCYTPQGQGVLNPVVVHLGQQSTVAYDEGDSMNVRYLAPTINSAILERTGRIVSTVGADGTTVTIHMPTIGGHILLLGEQFGQWYTETVNFFYRDSQPPVSAPRNHSAMNITLPEGDGARYRLQLIVEEQDTTNMVYVAYDPPQIRSVAPLNGPTAGGINLTITGINFGITTPTVMVGTENCPVIATDHFVIVCTLPPNQGLNHEVVVTVNGQSSVQTTKYLFNYDPPVLHSLSPTTGITNGGPVITLTGTNLGRRDAIVRFGTGSDGSLGWVAQGANITSQTDDEIQFTLLEGQGIGHAVSVTISGQASTYVGETLRFTYNPPSIDYISPIEAPTKGGTLLKIFGADFGISGLGVTLGGRDCTNPTQDHNLVTCRIPQGLGQNLQVLVTVLTRTSNAAIFNYSKPFVYTVVPNVPDANGAELEVVGVNFGWERTDVAIKIGEMDCLNAVWRNDGSLECTMQRDVAGQKNVTITVAGQTVQLVGPFVPQCSTGYYGQVGELCIPCPQGGVCKGSFSEPYSDAGWWEVKIDTSSDEVASGRRRLAEFSASCPVERPAGDVCSIMIPCEPKDSCLGNNTCSEGYTGERCGDCTVGTHYRLAGECVRCPDNPELIVAFFLVAALGLCISGYVLNRKGVNLAFLSIGVDYFQVLALFATSKVDWPPALYALFQYLSAFNLNLEIAAPECSIPDVQYQTKWFSIMLLPVAACALFLVLHTVKYVHKRWCKHVRKSQRNSHLSTMIGSLLVMFYYLYLYLTRTTLDVFNCGPTDPPDGKEYMEAVFEECYVAGLTQMTLLPFACVTLLVYTIGFPGFLFYTLRKNKDNIKTDQILRVLGEGSKRSSPTYQFRKRYHKMYYHFRPGKWYWILVIIGRKALLAVTALMFRSTAAFQLAMALLVMFVAYALQVRHTPYMNLHDKTSIMKKFHEKVASEKSALYAKIDTTIRSLMEDERRRTNRPRNWLQKRPSRQEVRQFFWDYNTVEAVLLFCAVLVNLAGIMFESGRFESSYYDGQRDLITYIVMFIVFASILYFVVVFCAEAFGVCTPGCLKKTKKLTREEIKQQKMEMTGRRQSIAVFQNNPMLTGANVEADDEHLAEFLGSDVLPPPGVWTTVRHKYQQLADTVQELNQAVRDMKRQQEGGGGGGGDDGEDSGRRKGRRGGNRRGNRTEFTARPAPRSKKRGGKKAGFTSLNENKAGADEAV